MNLIPNRRFFAFFVGFIFAVTASLAFAGGDEKTAEFIDHDMVMGDENAPIEIIEYASLTCSHCAAFHADVLPKLKEKYIKTGKVKIVFRHFLLNYVDMEASIVARCADEKKYFPMLGLMFKRQETWFQTSKYKEFTDLLGKKAGSDKFNEFTRGEVDKVAKMAGISKARADACRADPKIRDYLLSVYKEGVEKYKVRGTPAVYVNGEAVEENTYEAVAKAIEDKL